MISSHVYGLALGESDLLCAWTRPYGRAAVGGGLELRRGRPSDFARLRRALPGGNGSGSAWFQHTRLPDGGDYLRWPRLFEFVVASDGRRILGHPLRSVSRETFETYLLTQVLSFALLRHGLEPLHATTVVIRGKAVAFLGDCGYGKSTLAAACLRAGIPLLTDDLLVLRPVDGEPLAYPGLPRIKLMPAVARRLLGPRVRRCRMNPFTQKLIVRLPPEQRVSVPVPLSVIYALCPTRPHSSSRVVIRRLEPRAAWSELTKGTFNLVARDPDRLKRQFEWATDLAAMVPVKSLSYPRSLRLLPEVVAALVSDLAP
jgi:hypothetical protein